MKKKFLNISLVAACADTGHPDDMAAVGLRRSPFLLLQFPGGEPDGRFR